MYKNLVGQFKKQRLFSLLLVLNIIVSCLVICFSYGLYQNYNVIISKGEAEEINTLDILISDENTHVLQCTGLPTASGITPEKIIELLHSMPASCEEDMPYIQVGFLTPSPFFAGSSEDGSAGFSDDTIMYSDEAEASYGIVGYSCGIKDGQIIDAEGMFTEHEMSGKEKLVCVTDATFDAKKVYSVTYSKYDYTIQMKTLPPDADSIIFGGEKYTIKKVIDTGGMSHMLYIPLTAVPKGSEVLLDSAGDHEYRCFTFRFNNSITKKQYNDIAAAVRSIFGDLVYLQPIEFTAATEIYYYKTIMLISVIIAVLAAINMAILYRYILEKRSSQLAVFRICGCSKGKAIASYLLECLIINVPLFVLTQLVYHKLIMPHLSGLFPNMAGAYSFKLYAAVFGIYIAASTLVLLVMIIHTVRSHSLVDMKKSAKSTNKFGIMKVFEVVQLAAVITMLTLIVSAVISRYAMFLPFEKYIDRKGYMLIFSDMATYPEKLAEITGGAECITNQFVNAYDGDTALDGISYSDEFIKAYSPPIKEGKWLADTDETYEKDGYIPAVVTSCGGRYKVGDVFESDIIMSFDENGAPDKVAFARYKIIGVTEDNAAIASYIVNNYVPHSYNDIYAVFNNKYETGDLLLTRISDTYACYGHDGALHGAQFVFCDNMTDEEYTKLGEKLSRAKGSYAPLSEVYSNSMQYIYEQMYTLFPIAVCIFILTIISTVSISAIYTKRQLRNYAIFYICGARWRTCALHSLKNSAITCGIASILAAVVLIVGKLTFFKETVITFGVWHFAVCALVIVLYLALSMIMPLAVIGSNSPKEVLKEE